MAEEIPPSYGSCFQGITAATWNGFFAQYAFHIGARKAQGGPSDEYEAGILKQLCARSKITHISWFCGTSTSSGFENLILPHHKHDLTAVVQPGGQSFPTVLAQSNQNKTTISQECFANVNALRWSKLKASEPQRFTWVPDSKGDAHPNDCHYDDRHGETKVYTGSGFHRFVAYGLCNFKAEPPLTVYFAFCGN
jgi:hypothetical protein